MYQVFSNCHCKNNSITFSRTLHDFQVDEEALAALDYCILAGDFDICEAVPAGEGANFPVGSLVNPLAGVSIDMAGLLSTLSLGYPSTWLVHPGTKGDTLPLQPALCGLIVHHRRKIKQRTIACLHHRVSARAREKKYMLSFRRMLPCVFHKRLAVVRYSLRVLLHRSVLLLPSPRNVPYGMLITGATVQYGPDDTASAHAGISRARKCYHQNIWLFERCKHRVRYDASNRAFLLIVGTQNALSAVVRTN